MADSLVSGGTWMTFEDYVPVKMGGQGGNER